jgi:hypothetical protein
MSDADRDHQTREVGTAHDAQRGHGTRAPSRRAMAKARPDQRIRMQVLGKQGRRIGADAEEGAMAQRHDARKPSTRSSDIANRATIAISLMMSAWLPASPAARPVQAARTGAPRASSAGFCARIQMIVSCQDSCALARLQRTKWPQAENTVEPALPGHWRCPCKGWRSDTQCAQPGVFHRLPPCARTGPGGARSG